MTSDGLVAARYAPAAMGLTWSTANDNAAARAVYERVGARSRTDWVDYWLDT